jgi:hypothetical protein
METELMWTLLAISIVVLIAFGLFAWHDKSRHDEEHTRLR